MFTWAYGMLGGSPQLTRNIVIDVEVDNVATSVTYVDIHNGLGGHRARLWVYCRNPVTDIDTVDRHVSEDHQGSYAVLIAEVSHARAAIIADLVGVVCTGSDRVRSRWRAACSAGRSA